MNKLFEQVKRRTFIFTDEQITNKIQQLTHKTNYKTNYKLNELDIMFDLYEDKKILTEDEFITEIIQYLYTNSSSPKSKIDEIIKTYQSDYYNEYNKAIENKQSYYDAVYIGRLYLMSLLQPKYSSLDEDDADDDLPDDDWIE